MLSWMKFCARFLSKILNALPTFVIRFFGWCLAVLWFDIIRLRRNVVLSNLKIAFPEKTEAERIKLGRASVVMICKSLFEIFLLSRITDSWVEKHAVVEGAHHIEEALKQGKGVLALGMHIGNGDMGSNIVAKRYPVTIISKFFKNKLFNDFWFSMRGAQGVEYIEPHGSKTAFDILRALKKNRIVVFVLDQFMGKPYGVETQFFGRDTGTAYGLALFYLKTRAPVVPIYNYEAKDHKIHVIFEKSLQLDSFITDDQDATLQGLTQYFTDIIQNVVVKHPDQWMWLHRRWKRFE